MVRGQPKPITRTKRALIRSMRRKHISVGAIANHIGCGSTSVRLHARNITGDATSEDEAYIDGRVGDVINIDRWILVEGQDAVQAMSGNNIKEENVDIPAHLTSPPVSMQTKNQKRVRWRSLPDSSPIILRPIDTSPLHEVSPFGSELSELPESDVEMPSAHAKLSASFLYSNEVPDGTVLAPGVEFAKTWWMVNNGTTTWSHSTQLVFTAGHRMSALDRVIVGAVKAREKFEVCVGGMKAPDLRGRYVSYWRMDDGTGKLFGHTVWVDVTVEDPSIQVPDQAVVKSDPAQAKANEPTLQSRPIDSVGKGAADFLNSLVPSLRHRLPSFEKLGIITMAHVEAIAGLDGSLIADFRNQLLEEGWTLMETLVVQSALRRIEGNSQLRRQGISARPTTASGLLDSFQPSLRKLLSIAIDLGLRDEYVSSFFTMGSSEYAVMDDELKRRGVSFVDRIMLRNRRFIGV